MVMQAQVQWLNAIWLMSSSSDNVCFGICLKTWSIADYLEDSKWTLRTSSTYTPPYLDDIVVMKIRYLA